MLTAFGYLFIAASALLVRQVVVGRVDDTVSDFRDLTVALLNGDMDTVRDVSGRRGENVPDAAPSVAASGTTPADTPTVDGGNPAALLARVKTLGTNAKGYAWGATGPQYYDCSGIVWRALRDMGVYAGQRFTTTTFPRIAHEFSTKVTGPPIAGDILLWQTKHMGVSTGGDRYYSARSREKGIGETSLSGDVSYFGPAEIWRLK